jgi:hypothetical protein
MQKVLFIILLNASLISNMNSEKIIKNINIPSCKNCIFHKPNNNNNFASSSNLCEKFGEKNIITSEIEYDSVFRSRINEEKCGKEGKYFQEEPNINLKILKHYIIKNAFFNVFITCFLILLFYNSK